ncbi:hypothetical protein [Sphingosinicella microcystinivorans]|uniref:Uncharacterized protein n=1 Tax=Sphingosinicella microcystinivorans TaxID=335406 RepID=A0ABX9T349_SPHMI|nr:hypothetical protein [Sphingosinicella microcystinivorans]RKS91749.1 hypothetical protein DFR51_1318 [Sphingosinicella microcystinivorans]
MYRWILVFLVGYLILAYFLRAMRTRQLGSNGNEFLLAQIFNGTTFAGSSSIVWGILDPSVMIVIGETTMFLLVAGVAGMGYALRELAKLLRHQSF